LISFTAASVQWSEFVQKHLPWFMQRSIYFQ